MDASSFAKWSSRRVSRMTGKGRVPKRSRASTAHTWKQKAGVASIYAIPFHTVLLDGPATLTPSMPSGRQLNVRTGMSLDNQKARQMIAAAASFEWI